MFGLMIAILAFAMIHVFQNVIVPARDDNDDDNHPVDPVVPDIPRDPEHPMLTIYQTSPQYTKFWSGNTG